MRRCGVIVGFLAAAAVALASHAQTAGPSGEMLPSVLISRQLLASQHLAVGDAIELSTDPTGTRPHRVRIAGVYEPVPDPMRLGATRHEVRLHLPDLITMTADPADPSSADTVDAVNVAIVPSTATRIETLTRRLVGRLPGTIVRATSGDDQRAAPFVVLERFHLAIAIVTVVASSVFLLALMLMLVDERRATVGILRLIGVRRRRILLFVLIEGLLIASAGALFGVVIAAAFEGGINRFFQWRYDTALVFVRTTPAIALRSIAMSVPLGVLAAVAASWTLLRRELFSLTRR